MERRKIFRFIAYALLAVLTVFLLILYLIYLSAQKPPEFYQRSLEIPIETQHVRNKEVTRTLRNLNNAVQSTDKPWQGEFTDADLNAFLAVETSKPGANLLPKELREPRLSFSSRTVDLACRIEEGAFTGILHLGLSLTLPEPNRLSIRIREARIGKLPMSRDRAALVLQETLKKQGIEARLTNEAGDPVLSFPLKLNVGKNQIVLEELDIQNGVVRFSGISDKKKTEN